MEVQEERMDGEVERKELAMRSEPDLTPPYIFLPSAV